MMKIKLLVLMVLGFAGVASYGFLEFNNVDLELQSLKAISSVESFTSGFNCACSNSEEFSEGGFDSANCNVQYLVEPSDGPDGIHGTADDVEGVPHPDSLGLVGNMLCLWESHQDDYGGNIDLESEGCQSNDWLMFIKHNEHYWPPGFSPDLQFNDVFLTEFPSSFYENDMEREKKFYEHFKKNELIFKYFENDKDFFKHIKDKKQFFKHFKDKEGDLEQFKNEKEFFNHFKNKGGFMNHFEDREEFLKHIKDKEDFWKYFNDRDYKHESFTLKDALMHKGNSGSYGQAKKFAREATAGILNAAHSEINFPLTVKEVTKMTQEAIINDDYKEMGKELRAYNNLGQNIMCP